MKDHGVKISEACRILSYPRSSYYAIHKGNTSLDKEKKETNVRDKEIEEKIRKLKTNHPFWGYRRIRAWLKCREGIKISRNKVYRLMKKKDLLVNVKTYKAKRTPQKNKPRAERPNQFWGIDMTKFIVNSIGWVYLVVVLDWYTKKIVGWDISLRSKSADWLRAVNMAVLKEFPDGVRGKNLHLISDNGSQPTSTSFMKTMSVLEIEQIFTSYNNPKGNADTERIMRTIKEELVWINEFESFEEAHSAFGKWVNEDYNKLYVHSSLDYQSPLEFEERYYNKQLKDAA